MSWLPESHSFVVVWSEDQGYSNITVFSIALNSKRDTRLTGSFFMHLSQSMILCCFEIIFHIKASEAKAA